MTVIGYHVIGPARAVLWADSETYVEESPVGHLSKVTIDPVLGVAGTGRGNILMHAEAAAAIRGAESFEDAADRLCERLCRLSRSPILAEAKALLPRTSVYVVVGWSQRGGRVLGAVLDGGQRFEPRIAPFFASPEIDCFPDDEQGVIAAAQSQFAQIPGAAGGVVTMVEVTPSGIAAKPLFDLARGRMLRRYFDFGEGAGAGARQETAPGPVAGVRENSDSPRVPTSTRRGGPTAQ